MSTVNVMAREVAAKVVFYGPGLSGKTTSLKRIYESIKPSLRGELMSLPTEADRTLFFDFLPVRVEKVGDYALRLALYTVPGQVFYNATRKLVLQGADGVIFVADSNPGADDSNRESMANLEENLAEQGIRLDGFPLVIQYNKRDLPNAAPLEHMRASVNGRGVPEFETCATSGEGVLDTMKEMVRLVIKDLRARKVVPAPRAKRELPKLDQPEHPGLEAKIREQLNEKPAAPSKPAADPMGAVATLAPAVLVDPARAAEGCFARGDYEGCVRACAEAVQRGLSFAGGAERGSQAFLLGLDGRDVLELERRAAMGTSRIDDAAFALYVLAQTFVRLAHAGLPTPQQ
ncbi:MAG: GTP-binding protein [Myxococcaceae bacterium]|nr:GTP-binding protein [Myxococcaceae bacterium]